MWIHENLLEGIKSHLRIPSCSQRITICKILLFNKLCSHHRLKTTSL